MAEDPQKRLISYFDFLNKASRANIAYNDFIAAIKLKDHKAINETIVVQALDLIVQNKNSAFRDTLPSDTLLYRARIIDVKTDLGNPALGFDLTTTTHGFDRWNSIEPPLSRAPQGRSNINGMSYLYLASNKYTACCEVKPRPMELISLAEFKTQKDFNIVDFSKDKSTKEFSAFENEYNIAPARLITNMMFEFCKPYDNDDNYYTASQFIADYFRKAGFDGIKYRSRYGNADNYTIFNSYKDNFDFIKSENIVLYDTNNLFFNISDKKETIINELTKNLNDKNKTDIIQQVNGYIAKRQFDLSNNQEEK